MTTRTKTRGAFGALITSLAVLLLASPQPSLAVPPPLTPLPTLGGPFTTGVNINDAGQIVGYSLDTDINLTQYAVLWDAAAPHTITQLDSLGGFTSAAVDINAAGQIAGYSFRADNLERAVLWDADAAHTMHDLGTLPFDISSEAAAINATGHIVGFSAAGFLLQRAVLWDANAAHAIQELCSFGGAFTQSVAVAINPAGQIIGSSYVPGLPPQLKRAVFWNANAPDTIHDLGTLSFASSEAVAINTAGQIVGNAYTEFGGHHAVLWDADAAHTGHDLGILPGFTSSEAVAINAAGQIVGSAYTPNVGRHAVMWDADAAHTIHDLGVLPGFNVSAAVAINDAGQVVGYCDDAAGVQHAFVWDATNGMQDLGTLGGPNSTPVRINNHGKITGISDTPFIAPIIGGFRADAFVVTVPPNSPPIANAGLDQSIRAVQTVHLDGSASNDDTTASTLLVYSWSFTSRPLNSTATLTNANTATPSFVADRSGDYVVSLTVTDADGASGSDEVVISSNNLAPTANAGADQLGIVGNLVSLNGAGSTDPEHDALTYSWSITSAPGGIPALNGANTATPSFTPVSAGVYTLTLEVSDFIGPGTSDTVQITVTASIGSVLAGQSLTLNGGSLNTNLNVAGTLILINGAELNGNLKLSSGGSVTIASGSSVTGDLKLSGSSTATIDGGTLTGNLTATGTGTVVLTNATLGNDVKIKGGGTITINPGTSIDGNLDISGSEAGGMNRVSGASLGNDATIKNNAASMVFGSGDATGVGNTVHGNLTFSNNAGVTKVFGNTIGNNLSGSGNTAITGGSNTAKKKSGQCAGF